MYIIKDEVVKNDLYPDYFDNFSISKKLKRLK